MVRTAMVFCGLLAFGMPRCGTAGATKGVAPGNTPMAQTGTAQATVAPQPQSQGRPPSAVSLTDMLRDPLLWGPDYPAALNAIPAFAKGGEQQVEILPRRVIGRRKETPAEAERAASIAREAYSNTPPMRIAVVPQAEAQRHKLPQIAAVLFPDDRKFHVGTPDHDARYIAVSVRIDQVEQRWGKAERVTTEILDDGTDRRPIELTLYHYANDAIIVVTADINSDPRIVDRVFLDTRAVMQAIF